MLPSNLRQRMKNVVLRSVANKRISRTNFPTHPAHIHYSSIDKKIIELQPGSHLSGCVFLYLSVRLKLINRQQKYLGALHLTL